MYMQCQGFQSLIQSCDIDQRIPILTSASPQSISIFCCLYHIIYNASFVYNCILLINYLVYSTFTGKSVCVILVTFLLSYSIYLHFLCESLNEPLHLPQCSYFMNNIASRDVTWHPWMRAILAYQRQGQPITLFVY